MAVGGLSERGVRAQYRCPARTAPNQACVGLAVAAVLVAFAGAGLNCS